MEQQRRSTIEVKRNGSAEVNWFHEVVCVMLYGKLDTYLGGKFIKASICQINGVIQVHDN